MGEVVKLKPPAKDRPRGKARARPKRSKTALVLGGGAITGGVYEVGALRALDLLTVNRTVNDFDVYVGTSVGSFVAALMANGVRPDEMMRVADGQPSTSFVDAGLGNLMRPNIGGFAKSAVMMPLRAVQLVAGVVANLGQVSAMDVLFGLGDVLPSGVYTGASLERYMRKALEQPGRSNDFRQVGPELYLTGTDLDTSERVVFGSPDWDDVPISTAVRASTALPMMYAPTVVRDRHFVDGGVASTTNIDIAVDAGAKFIVVINPLVPYHNDFKSKIRTLTGTRTRHVSDMGLAAVGYQIFKMVLYQRLHEKSRQWEQRYPGVDIVLIEPEPNDELMFQTPIMSYASRVAIARHGFQSVTTKLAFGYPHFAEVCQRHGIEISATRVRKVMKHFEADRGRTSAWRKILEQTTGALLRQTAGEPLPGESEESSA
jgi:NTE family protein